MQESVQKGALDTPSGGRIVWLELPDGRHAVLDEKEEWHEYKSEFTARDSFYRAVIHTIPEGRIAKGAYSGRWLA